MGKRFINFSMFIFSFLIAFFTACPVFAFFEGSDDHEAWRDQMFGTSAAEASLPSSSQEFKQSSKEVLIDEKGMSQELKETTTAPLIKAAASSRNYSITPDQIPFYKLADYGYENVLQIIKDILANNTTYTMLVNVVSDNVVRINICDYGNLWRVRYARSSSDTTDILTYYGTAQRTSFTSPAWFGLEYRFSTDKWYNGRNSWMNDSYFGYQLNNFLYSEGTKAFSVISRPYSATTLRDWYFYGFQTDVGHLFTFSNRTNLTMTNYGAENVGVSNPYPRYNLIGITGVYSFGKTDFFSAAFTSGVWLSDTNYTSLLLEAPPQTYSTDHSTFQQSIQTFITKTADFNSLMSQNQATLKANVKSFFDVFNSVLPTSVIIILILLIVVVVCIGVFK